MEATQLTLKALHIVGVTLFLGNMIVSGFWKFKADHTRNPMIIAFAQRQVTWTDFLFTGGGGALLLASGLYHAHISVPDYWAVGWVTWGISLFVASGIIWAFILLPIQRQQSKIVKEFKHNSPIPEVYWKLERTWYTFGLVAIALPLATIYWMVFKP